MNVDGRPLRAVWWDHDAHAVAMIDQRVLPGRVEIVRAHDVAAVAGHIRDMTVRGAPTIGATAAYGMALGADDPDAARALLAAARPTARDLFAALEFMAPDPSVARAETYADDIVERCRRIGVLGAEVLARHGRGGTVRVLTHCNAGALAAVDHGTALAPVHHLAALPDPPVRPFVWVDETRPRLQGALTAWELRGAGVPHKVIVDGAAASRLAAGEVDVVLVGADRIAANGDVANKIGTLGLAVAAHTFGVPFYVAAPRSTFDPGTTSGAQIRIEERGADEVRRGSGTEWLDSASPVANPAFDVTAARFIRGYLTEFGLLSADELGTLLKQPMSTARSR